MAGLKPISFRLRTYQVGFGDCFLLTFRYPPTSKGKSRDRHMLIDLAARECLRVCVPTFPVGFPNICAVGSQR